MKLNRIISVAASAAIIMTSAAAISLPTAYAVTDTETNTFTEDFAGYTSTSLSTTLKALMNDGWYMVGENTVYTDTSQAPYKNLTSFVQGANVDGRQCLMIGTPNQSTAYSAVGLGRYLPGVSENGAATGVWEINFSFKPYATSNAPVQFLFCMNTADGSAANGAIAQHNILAAYNNKMYIGYRDYNTLYNSGTSVLQGTLSGGSIDLSWYDVKATVNCDARYYSVELYKSGKLIARRSPISFSGNETIGFLKLSALGLGNGHRVYIDDISIAPVSRETLIYEDGFDYENVVLATSGMTVGGSAESAAGNSYFEGFTPWRALSSAGNAYGLEPDSILDSQVVRLGDDPETIGTTEKSGLVYMPVKDKILEAAKQEQRGKLKISFKIKPDAIGASGFQVYCVSDDKGTNSSTPFALVDNDGTPAVVVDGENVDLVNEKWYEVELVLDPTNHGATATVTDIGADAVVAGYSKAFASLTAVKGIMFNAVGGTTVHMDDFKLEYYEPAPSFDAGAIVVTDQFNNAITDTTDVTAAVKSIKMPFGCDLDQASASSIKLRDGNGDEVVSGGASRLGNAYTLNFTELLKENTTYTLTIPSTVANVFGVQLGGVDRTFTFTTTDKLSDLMNISSVKVGDASVSALSDITAGSTLNVAINCANSKNEAINGTAIMVFYDSDNKIVKTLVADEKTVAAGSYRTDSASFDVPNDLDMSKVDKISVLLWDGFTNITPYCEAITFETVEE